MLHSELKWEIPREEVSEAINGVLESTTLQDLVGWHKRRQRENDPESPVSTASHERSRDEEIPFTGV